MFIFDLLGKVVAAIIVVWLLYYSAKGMGLTEGHSSYARFGSPATLSSHAETVTVTPEGDSPDDHQDGPERAEVETH